MRRSGSCNRSATGWLRAARESVASPPRAGLCLSARAPAWAGRWRNGTWKSPALPTGTTLGSGTCHRSAAGWLRAVCARRAAKRRMPCSGAKPRASIGSARGSQHASEASLCCSRAKPCASNGRLRPAGRERSGPVPLRRGRAARETVVTCPSSRTGRCRRWNCRRRTSAVAPATSSCGSARAQAKPGAWCGSTPPWERARGRSRPRVVEERGARCVRLGAPHRTGVLRGPRRTRASRGLGAPALPAYRSSRGGDRPRARFRTS